MHSKGFTLVEMTASVLVVTILSVLLAKAGWKVYERSSLAVSANNIRVLAAGGAQYLADNNHRFWRFREDDSKRDTTWWWGAETRVSQTSGEGNRSFDPTQGPLAGYVPSSIRPDPSFALGGSVFKPKFRSGYIGVGYNILLAGSGWNTPSKLKPQNPVSYWQLSDPSQVVVFATSAQVNTFQSPASPKNPMLEEFYGIDEREVTVHFRHGGAAMVGFANGSAGFLPMDESTRDKRMPEANVGRFAPKGSKKYLE